MKGHFQFIVLALTLALCCCALKVKVDDVTLMVEANGGKVTAQYESESKLALSVMSLVEKGATGNDVPVNASVNPHKVMLETHPFSVPTQVTNVAGTSQIIDHIKLTMTGTIPQKQKNATLEIMVRVAKKDGNLQGYNSNYTYAVKEGQGALYFKVSDWNFCGSSGFACLQANGTAVFGEYLDLILKVSNGGAAPSGNTVVTFGSKASVTLEKKVAVIDKTSKAVTAAEISGFPKRSSNLITVRLKKFGSSQFGAYGLVTFRVSSGGTLMARSISTVISSMTAIMFWISQ